MTYRIRVVDDGRYVLVQVVGEITIETAREWSFAAQEAAQEAGLKRFLFDMREARNVATILENYLFANEDMREMEFDRDVRSAILARPEDWSHDYVAKAFRSAGFDVRLFRDEGEALEWLAAPSGRADA